MVWKSLLCLVPLAVLAACGPTPGPDTPVIGAPKNNLPGAGGSIDAPQGSLGGAELCNAEQYRPLVGQPHTESVLPVGPKFRVYSDVAVVTQEYLPDRTNIVFDDRNGAILRVFCG